MCACVVCVVVCVFCAKLMYAQAGLFEKSDVDESGDEAEESLPADRKAGKVSNVFFRPRIDVCVQNRQFRAETPNWVRKSLKSAVPSGYYNNLSFTRFATSAARQQSASKSFKRDSARCIQTAARTDYGRVVCRVQNVDHTLLSDNSGFAGWHCACTRLVFAELTMEFGKDFVLEVARCAHQVVR